MQKDHLLKIIKALTVKEKKDFKQQVSKEHKTKIPYFFQLFKQYEKLISKSKSDEEFDAVLHKFFIRNPKLHKDIANVRKQLKEKIFSHFVKAQKKYNTKDKVSNEIKIIKLLIRRGLFEEALLSINKVKKLARRYDLNKDLMEITDWHLTIIDLNSGITDLQLQKKLAEEFNYYHSIYSTEFNLKNVLRQYILILQNDVLLQKKESQKAFHNIRKQYDFKNFQIKPYEKEKHTHIVSFYYRILNIYHRQSGNFSEAFESSQRLIEYFESDESLVSNFEIEYIKSICSFTKACQSINALKALEESIEKIKCLYEKGANYNALEATCDIGVLHYLSTYQYDKAIELVNFIKKDWVNISKKIIYAKLLWYCHFNLLLFWVTNQSTEFEYWLNNGLNIPRSNKGKDYYFGIRMFELIYDYEQENWLHFFQKVEALQKTLQNNNNLTAFEQTVLLYFRKLYNNSQNVKSSNKQKLKSEKETFQSLKSALKILELKKIPINYEEILLWCESHLQNKTIKEVFEADNQK